MAHDWHLMNAEDGTEARIVARDHVQVRHPDGTVEDLTWEEFNQRRGSDDE